MTTPTLYYDVIVYYVFFELLHPSYSSPDSDPDSKLRGQRSSRKILSLSPLIKHARYVFIQINADFTKVNK